MMLRFVVVNRIATLSDFGGYGDAVTGYGVTVTVYLTPKIYHNSQHASRSYPSVSFA